MGPATCPELSDCCNAALAMSRRSVKGPFCQADSHLAHRDRQFNSRLEPFARRCGEAFQAKVLLHAADDFFIVQSFGLQDLRKPGELWKWDVAVVAAAGAPIGRHLAEVGVAGPNDLTIAVSGFGEARLTKRGG